MFSSAPQDHLRETGSYIVTDYAGDRQPHNQVAHTQPSTRNRMMTALQFEGLLLTSGVPLPEVLHLFQAGPNNPFDVVADYDLPTGIYRMQDAFGGTVYEGLSPYHPTHTQQATVTLEGEFQGLRYRAQCSYDVMAVR